MGDWPNKTLKAACKMVSPHLTHVLEFGVCGGGTMLLLKQQIEHKVDFFGFDSFIGLPEDWTGTTSKKGAMDLGGVIPNIPDVKFFKGWFKDTVHEYLKEAKQICLLHIDCDLYSSTKDVLWNLNDYITKDTIIVFDEWYYNVNPMCAEHEQKAYFEWIDAFKRECVLFPEIDLERKLVRVLK